MSLLDRANDALWIVENDPNPIAYDVETSGLDWKRNAIVGYVITGKKTLAWSAGAYGARPYRESIPLQSIYVPIRHAGGGNLASPGVLPLTDPEGEWQEHWFERKLAAAFEVRAARAKAEPGRYITVGHNIGFDGLFSWKHGIKLGRKLADTQHQATMLDEYQDSFSLERTAIVFGATPKLGKGLYEHLHNLGYGPAKKEIMAHYWRTSGADPIVADYAAGDGFTTLEVYWLQLPFLAEERLNTIMAVENDLIWTLVRMEHFGWKLATERFAEVLADVNKMLEEAKAKLPYGFNVRSSGAVRAIAERTGNTNWPTTAPTPRFPGGQPSFKEEFLETWEEGKAILRVRRLEKLCSSFIIPMMEKHNFNGRIHGHLNQLKADEYGTISGRLSASSPNLQQIPARDPELATLIRRLFAADAGMTLYEADYSQQEPRLWAHYSHDPFLVDGYSQNPPIDVHTQTAEITGTIRKDAKSINLGLFYMMWKKSFHRHLKAKGSNPNITRAETDTIYDLWYGRFTKVREFQRDATDVFKSRGWVRTILGRRARTDGSDRFYVAPNRIIQGSAADISKFKLLEIDMYFEEHGDIWHLLMMVHDSFIFEGPSEDLETPQVVVKIMTDLNGAPFKLTVPFTVDMTDGKDWAEVKFGKEEDT